MMRRARHAVSKVVRQGPSYHRRVLAWESLRCHSTTSAQELEAFRDRVRAVVTDPKLNFKQRRYNLAYLAESVLPYPNLDPKTMDLLGRNVIHDLFEGPAPYRPRYTLPDYAISLKNGSAYLELPPATTLDEALSSLMILWHNTPTITGFPVWIGDIDALLEPYVADIPDDILRQRLKVFWRMVDRMFPDGFCHANIGPKDSRVGRIILSIERELRQTAPNLTLKVDPQVTTPDFILDAINTCVEVSKPHFVNHRMMVEDLGPNYGVASCYNSLKVGGGSHTLTRLNLRAAADGYAGSPSQFLSQALPEYVERTCEVIAARVRYLVEEQQFYEHDFMVKEGLLTLDRFSAMFGVVGVAEFVEHLGVGKYGLDKEANEFALATIKAIHKQLEGIHVPYCQGFGNRAMLHAQAGINIDDGITPGARVAFQNEPQGLLDHILAVAPGHKWFPSGVSDIFHFEETVKNAPEAVARVLHGGMAAGLRDFTFDVRGGEFVRVTGYLIRRADAEQFEDRGSRIHSDVFGAYVTQLRGLFNRPARALPDDPFQGLVSHVIPFSVVDGPGSRMAIFLQECNLRCIHCHNPSTLGSCDGCGVCAETCPEGNLQVKSSAVRGPYVEWDESKCLQCGLCLASCRRLGDPHARWRTATEVVDDIAKGAGMLDGVTITGGEPTLQPTFVAAVSSMLKADPRTRDLHRLLDSNGVVPPDVWDQLLPHVDGVAISIKAGSAEAYERVTGRKDCLPAVRQTLQSLHERGKLLEARVVLIEGVNDTQEELQLMAQLLQEAAPGACTRAHKQEDEEMT